MYIVEMCIYNCVFIRMNIKNLIGVKMRFNKIVVIAIVMLTALVLNSQEPVLLKMNAGINSGFIGSDAGTDYKVQGNFGQSIVASVVADDKDAFLGFWSPIDLITLGVEDDVFSSQERRIKNYPNPFRDYTDIKFELEGAANVSLKIYDVNGALVSEIFKGYLGAGEHSVSWNALRADGQIATNGTYLYELTVDPMAGSNAFKGQYTLRNIMVLSR